MASDGETAFDESFFDAPGGGDSDGAPTTPVRSKRKRGPMNSPGAVNDEDEVARRRRRRQSLAFLQRRKSLTLTSGKTKSSEDGGAASSSSGTSAVSRASSFARTTSSTGGSSHRQYVSDMYSTIIKMSSENKINVKNSWSLHLIDHMEDILGSSRKENEEDPDDTYNFQKASCTLDASIKIYSYRVDDTWNSSYKILENLSRTDDTSSKQQAASDDDENPDEPKSARKTRKPPAAARTIEKNLNNINLKSYELEFEADPLFHKMSQSFDEGGAKGMLLANLGHYDGCKILLNSSDVGVSTRKVLAEPATTTASSERADSDVKEEETVVKVKQEAADLTRRVSLASFGELACFTEDVQAFEVCPPLGRLYKQLDEFYGEDGPQLKVKTTSEHLIKTPVKPKRLAGSDAAGSGSVRARLDFDDMGDEPSQPMEVIDEGDEDAAEAMDVDMEGEHTEQNNNSMNEFDFGGADNDAGNESADGTSQVDDGATERGEESQVAESQMEAEEGESPVEEAPPDASASAADFFRARSQRAQPVKDDAASYTLLIENALLRSAAGSGGGDDLNGLDDYSYFDVKMLRNWAGPVHWKFPAVRKVQAKQVSDDKVDELAPMDAGSDGEDDESGAGGGSKAAPKTPRSRKATAENRSALIDFFAMEELDMGAFAKQPRASSASINMSKVMAKRQSEKVAELLFPVDSHLELGVFLQHFKKPKLRFFKRQAGQAPDTNDFVSNTLDAAYREPANGATYDENHASSEETDQNSVSNYGDEYDFDGAEDDADDELYSTEGLVSASRVVEKVDVHYERFAKRVDVKKLKHNIWEHLEKETTLLGTSAAEVERLTDDFAAQTSISGEDTTTFESVVQSVSDRVPPDVTVSFYFICMLHLANEKGLKLSGQEDLCNFTIQKDADE